MDSILARMRARRPNLKPGVSSLMNRPIPNGPSKPSGPIGAPGPMVNQTMMPQTMMPNRPSPSPTPAPMAGGIGQGMSNRLPTSQPSIMPNRPAPISQPSMPISRTPMMGAGGGAISGAIGMRTPMESPGGGLSGYGGMNGGMGTGMSGDSGGEAKRKFGMDSGMGIL